MLATRSAQPDDLGVLAALAAPLQRDPTRFQAYFGEEVDEIAAEIAELEDWPAQTVVAEADRDVVGWVFAEYDDELDRVWWWGPVVAPGRDWSRVAEELLDAATDGCAGRFSQFEFAVDGRHSDAIALARRRGYRQDVGSVLLLRSLDELPRAEPAGVQLATVDASTEAATAALHDATFPGSHLTGRQLVEGAPDAVVRVAVDAAGEVVGYVRAERQPSGDGYVDFLGVDPGARGGGVGAALVLAALCELQAAGAASAHLTVREDNAAARTLYARLGFDGSRVLVPLRLGFEV